jgi:hypothetical protein
MWPPFIAAILLVVFVLFFKPAAPSAAPVPVCIPAVRGSTAVPVETTTDMLLGSWTGGGLELEITRRAKREDRPEFTLEVKGKSQLTCEFTEHWRPNRPASRGKEWYRAWCSGLGITDGSTADLELTSYDGGLLGLAIHDKGRREVARWEFYRHGGDH